MSKGQFFAASYFYKSRLNQPPRPGPFHCMQENCGLDGYAITKAMIPEFQSHFESLVNSFAKSWHRKDSLTDLLFFNGIKYIYPHSEHTYTKPILMLVNELSFSGEDVVPCILQDNKRAILMGTRTAGAGGAATSFQFRSRLGIKSIQITDRIFFRADGSPIQGVGATPDIPYSVGAVDLLNNYSAYKDAINQAVKEMMAL